MDRQRRAVFYVSDGTGITAETVGHSLLTQFGDIDCVEIRVPFVADEEKAHAVVARIRNAQASFGTRPIVISTVVDPRLSHILASSGGLMLDIFEPFIAPLELEFGRRRQPRVGQAHGLTNYATYEARINATNFALAHDDGVNVNYAEADVILIGVSRSGKTPTCLYLALHYGLRAGNYPLTPDDLETEELPRAIRQYRNRLFALTIDPVRLQQVREARRPGSRYATLEQCHREVAAAESLFRRERLPMLSTTHTSIEEIASKVMAHLGIDKRMF